jgi:hypothetical protein
MDIGFHVINALPPTADQFTGSDDTDIIDAGAGAGVLFIVQTGAVSGAAANTVTVEACSTITATAVATVPFVYRTCLSGDTWGAWTAATTAGFSMVHTASAANAMWQIYVDSAEIAEQGYQYVRLSTDETADFTVLGGILALIINPRYAVQPSSALD